jgi:translation elongation factor EF-Tu-like GTPase
MALTGPLIRTRLRSLTVALIVVVLLAVPTLTTPVSAQHVETEERGADTAASSGYRPQFYIRTMDIVNKDGELTIVIIVIPAAEAEGDARYNFIDAWPR